MGYVCFVLALLGETSQVPPGEHPAARSDSPVFIMAEFPVGRSSRCAPTFRQVPTFGLYITVTTVTCDLMAANFACHH